MGFRQFCLLPLLLLLPFPFAESRHLVNPCTVPEKNARHVNFDNCDGLKIEDVIEFTKNAVSISARKSSLFHIPPNAFQAHEKTTEVDFSGNIDLHIPVNQCFLISNYIERLKISDIPNLPVLPSTIFECLPNLRELRIGGENCMKTKELLEDTYKNLSVFCEASYVGKTYPEDERFHTMDTVSSTPSTTVLFPRKISSQETDYELLNEPDTNHPHPKPNGTYAENHLFSLCTLPEKNARHVNFDNCDGLKFEDVIESTKNAVSFSARKSSLFHIPPNAFQAHEKTTEVDFSGNTDLLIPVNQCFLLSNYIERLKISDIPNLPVLPFSVFECLPNLRELWIGGENCMKTKELLEDKYNNLSVFCEASYVGKTYPEGERFHTMDTVRSTPSLTVLFTSQISSQETDYELPSTPEMNLLHQKPQTSTLLHYLLWSSLVGLLFIISCLCFKYRYIIRSLLSCHKDDTLFNKNGQCVVI